MNNLFCRTVQIVSIPLLYALAYCLDLWRLSASYDVSAMRFSIATFFAMTFPQTIFLCVVLLLGYLTSILKPAFWVSVLYIAVGGYVALLPTLLLSSYGHPYEIHPIMNFIAYPTLLIGSTTRNGLYTMASSALVSVGLLALFTSLYALYKTKTA
ncbi:MAG: hypothetical protein WC657_09710 [Candidatus Paceibacterota bacterium]